jgi:hypothetical protein
MFHHLEYKKAVSNSALCGLHADENKGTDPRVFKVRKRNNERSALLELAPGISHRYCLLRQGFCCAIPWVRKQYNTFPPFKELSHDEGRADFAQNLRASPFNKDLSKDTTF